MWFYDIGAACARELWKLGAHLALSYSKSKDAVDQLVSELQAASTHPAGARTISVHQADVGAAEDLHRMWDEIHRHHARHPDILVSNAGHGRRVPDLADITLEEWEHTIRVNLTASFVLCKLAVPHMQARRWGRIVLMGSIAGYGGGINGCHYAASKAGLMGLVKNLAMKHAADGITVNDVAPAMIGATGMVPDESAVVGTRGDVRNIPVGRLGTPAEVANVVVMLCKTGYLTGQSILLSGGLK
ncbi:3-oxoacyl-reductase FabG [Escovopsis weberi]|uniref:3-oxoacyl-reductase FabG n=1 Tax=Escovopsis weberi TaxID=150374 RepID=A0A0M8MS58_ESCWE|nr:3-oxoacyl-reductase FabG [Escovopsis weberi]